MEHSYGKTLIITNDLKVIIQKLQTDTQIIIERKGYNNLYSFVKMDIDHWTEFKKAIKDIDDEFMKRFKYPYPTV